MNYQPPKGDSILNHALITQRVAGMMQEVLNTVAKKAGPELGFVKRRSPIDGSVFVKTIVFSALNNPSASLGEMSRTAKTLGINITPQALDQRFTKEAGECLKKVLEEAVKKVISKMPGSYPLLSRFKELYIQDSSTIMLPDKLKKIWKGLGGGENTSSSALKIQLRFELKTGVIDFFELTNGKDNDPGSGVQKMSVSNGALSLADLGYWSVRRFHDIVESSGYFLSRMKTTTNVFYRDGSKFDLLEHLKTTKKGEFDMGIRLSTYYPLNCRLIGKRVPLEVSNQRRRKLKKRCKQIGTTPSQTQLAFCDWTILVTNIPRSMLSIEEALVILRVRWQIELVFKFWKSENQIDKSRSKKPYHILCDIYGKLLAAIIKHWVILCSKWKYLEDSLFKAGKEIQAEARILAHSINNFSQLCVALTTIATQLDTGCKIGKRKSRPSTIQRLYQFHDESAGLRALA